MKHENNICPTLSTRPSRIKVPNVHGQQISLNFGEAAFNCLHSPENMFDAHCHIVLGIGYSPQFQFAHQTLAAESTKVFYLESPCMQAELGKQDADFTKNIPGHWQEIDRNALLKLMESCKLPMIYWWFKQNLLLDTMFWLPILADVLSKNTSATSTDVSVKSNAQQCLNKSKVLMGSHHGQLLHKEICSAFAELGFTAHGACVNPKTPDLSTKELSVMHCDASLYFSINLQGLDAEGYAFALLQGLGIPVAVWFVDNPWHVLTKLRLPWWKKAHLFVTDASFIADLRREGAENVQHLPLATAQHMWGQHQIMNETLKTYPALAQAQCVFVGRAAFPDKAHFFAASPVPDVDVQTACALMQNSTEKPDFHWWTQRLWGKDCAGKFWPKNEVRKVGHGAELSAQAQRVQWLRALTTLPCAVFGDAQLWQALLPQAPTHIFYNELDYYGSLPSIYGAAKSVLNVTSLLLPHGLTQRHFDVWAAGGFLWTNATHGLDIFPQELTKPIAHSNPRDFLKAMENLAPCAQQELKLGWQECLAAQHQYTHRLRFVLECVM